MSNVVAFATRAPKVQQTPHMHGEAVCMACGHHWQAVAQVGTKVTNVGEDEVSMECPACTALKGVMRCHVLYTGTSQYTCACGGFLFSIIVSEHTKQPALACAACGHVSDLMECYK